MPILNGQKVACGPCIRGHRSTKCNHGGERVMLIVRKPGRPLSTCPCPPGKPCACGGVKVAIPRKQKCGCPPETENQSDTGSQEHSPIQPSASPTRSTFRVSKSSTVPRAGGRKQSFDPSNLHRVDPSAVNMMIPAGISLDASTITSTMTMVTNSIAAQAPPPDLAGFGVDVEIGNTSNGAFSPPFSMPYGPPFSFNMPLQYPASHPLSQHRIKIEGQLSSSMDGGPSASMPPPPPPYVNGHRHVRSSSLGGPEFMVDLGPPLMPDPATKKDPAPGSCCGGGREVDNAMAARPSPYSKPFVPQYPPPGEIKQQNIQTSFHMSTVFTYPAEYGSWNMPINPQLWQQIATLSSQPTISPAPVPTTPNSATPDLGVSHQCSCGPGCQCLGCLAHPFNDQMYQYVSSAYTESSGVNGQSTQNGHERSSSNVGSCCGNGDSVAAPTQTPTIHPQSPTQLPESPPEARTPSDASAVSEEQQSLSSFDYLWVDMPPRAEDACGGLMASCPCGDDCSCVGCSLHNAPPVKSP